jgi:hypothetical protein
MPVAKRLSGRHGNKISPAAVQPGPAGIFLHLAIFFLLFTAPLILLHWSLLSLPYFWDEHGQFIPTALDLLRTGAWVAHSTLPNIHPPGVEAYLVLWYKLFGYSIPVTRIAMLTFAGFGLLVLFLLSIELSRKLPGVPAFYPPVLLAISPLFYMQSMMAQLDMPAMVLTLLTLLLFLKERYVLSALAAVALVMTKETGAVTPAVLFGFLLWKRQFRQASLFLIAPAALGLWLLILHKATGYWMGNPGFEHYNVSYSLHPVRFILTVFRRIYYLFFAEFRWIGTVLIFLAHKRLWTHRTAAWNVIGAVCIANVLLVSLFGGAALERYLLPVLPFFYIAAGFALVLLPRWQRIGAAAALMAGLIVNIYWNPPYPFPFENNYAMVDFVELQRVAAGYLEDHAPDEPIATAWPYTAALRDPDYGYVHRPLKVVETNDFHLRSIRAIPSDKYSRLVIYTRTWTPKDGLMDLLLIRKLLERYYEFEPEIDPAQCAALGLQPMVSWERRGQTITIYGRQQLRQIP